jgi:hypothetical protein
MKQNPPTDWLLPKTQNPFTPRPVKSIFLKPPLPTKQERKEVVDYIMAKNKTPENERLMTESFFDGSVLRPIVVFDHYETNGFEYEGKLLLAVSDYDPIITEAYIWRNGKIESIDRLHQQIERKAKA